MLPELTVTEREQKELRAKTKWNATGLRRGRARKWDREAIIRFVCDKMCLGYTISEVVDKIQLPGGFLHLIEDCESDHSVKSQELLILYRKAKREQALRWAESTSEIATGRDRYSREMQRKMDRILRKELRRALRRHGKKSGLDTVARILEARSGIKELDRNLIARNKLMMDAHKWLASVTDAAYRTSTNNIIAPASGGDGKATEFIVKFVKPGADA